MKNATLKRRLGTGLLLLALGIAALSGNFTPGQEAGVSAGVRTAYAACDGQPPPPDPDCPPTPTPTPTPDPHR